MKSRRLRRSVALTLALTITAGVAAQGLVSAADTMPFTGVGERGENQPTEHGYRVTDILNWDPTTDVNAEFMRAQVPLQQRNEAFAATQANPDLSPDTRFFDLAGDYGNAFFESYQSNDNFSNYLFNFWQYTDYYGSWHGQTTAEVPTELWDTSKDWEWRFFEFGILNMPNPAYTNAAHKNGTMSIGCLFLPRDGQSASPMLEKDENGEYPAAKKLIEMCRYFGFDGYFINQEEGISTQEVVAYQEFMKYMRDQGIYVQWYDSAISPNGGVSYQNEFNAKNSPFVYNEERGRVSDSIFLNYWWNQSKIDNSVAHANSLGIDPLETVFFGLEGGGNRWNQPYDLQKLFGEDGNPVASIAIIGTDFVHHGMAEDVKSLPANAFSDPDYQWLAFERERIWFSGPEKDPTNPGVNASVNNAEVTGSSSSNVAGMADYITERSVISGTEFYTNFNTGHGMQYFKDGSVSNDNEWTNMNIQELLPTWQWWIDSEGDKLSVNFDYGEKYNKGPYYDYQSVGAYNGGSSLVVNGDLNAENFLRLYKTDLSVTDTTKANITYNKVSATDSSTMELGVIFKSAPDTVVTFNVPKANQQTDGWITKSVNLSDYAGEEIAAMGLVFKNGKTAITDYQMNIGNLEITDQGDYTPAQPTGFSIQKAFDSTEMYVQWDLADYDDVQQYNLYAQLSDGTTRYVGGSYDNVYYVKSLYEEKDVAKLLLTAVGKDGSESDPAELSFSYQDNISNIEYTSNPGYIDFTWDAPANDQYDSIQIDITFDATDKTDSYSATVEKGATSARVWVPVGDGTRFTAKFSTIRDGVKGEAIAQSGRTTDCYSMPYQGGYYSFSGGTMTLHVPDSIDWWHMYVKVNGETRTYSMKDGTHDYKTRGKNDIKITSLKEGDVVSITLEDYKGNLSEANVFTVRSNPDAEITAELFPDAALLGAVKNQIGSTIADLDAFNGVLDLSNLEIADYTGLNLIAASEINLTGSALETVSKDTFSPNVGKIVLRDSKGLTQIDPNAFKNSEVTEIDISGCTALQVLGLNNSKLEKITCTDPETFADIVSVDLSGSRFDLTAGTPEQIFAQAMAAQTQGKQDIVIDDDAASNLALGAEVIDAQNISNAGYLFDGAASGRNYASASAPGSLVIDLGAQQPVEAFKLTSRYNFYAPQGVTLSYSNNGKDFTTLGTAVTGNDQQVIQQSFAPVDARYIKLEITEVSLYGSIQLMELELTGIHRTLYKAGVDTQNQRPAAYAEMDDTVRLEKTPNKIVDMHDYLNSALTVRGNDFASLKDASFVDPDYDLANAAANEDVQLIKITDANGNVGVDTIDLSSDGAYTVEYITFNDADYHGKTLFTQKVYVRAVTSVLEQIIANAEELLATGALDNTMEAVVTEFNAALANAKEIVTKDGATQAEINAATTRLLEVMAKVDWKQGDKTALQVAVDIANAIKPDLDLYVEAGKQEFLDALGTAEALLASGNAWDDDIKAATAELMEAMSNLRMAANKDVLNEMINQANAVDLSAYTEESANAVRSALADAEALAADCNATQDAVDAAADTLKAALGGLTFGSGDNSTPNDNTTDGTASAGNTTTVGDGSAPTKTGDGGSFAGAAALAVLSAAGALFLLKKKER